MSDILFDFPVERNPHKDLLEKHLRGHEIQEHDKIKAIGALYEGGEHEFVKTYLKTKAMKDIMEIGAIKRRREGSGSQVIYEEPPTERPPIKRGRRLGKGSKPPRFDQLPKQVRGQVMMKNSEGLVKDTKEAKDAVLASLYDILRASPNISNHRAIQVLATIQAEAENFKNGMVAVGGGFGYISNEHRHKMMAQAFDNIQELRDELLVEVGGEEALEETRQIEADNFTNLTVDLVSRAAKGKNEMVMGQKTDDLMEISDQFMGSSSEGDDLKMKLTNGLIFAEALLAEVIERMEKQAGRKINARKESVFAKICYTILAYIRLGVRKAARKIGEKMEPHQIFEPMTVEAKQDEKEAEEKAETARSWWDMSMSMLYKALKILVGALLVGLFVWFAYRLAMGPFDATKHINALEAKTTELKTKLSGARSDAESALGGFMGRQGDNLKDTYDSIKADQEFYAEIWATRPRESPVGLQTVDDQTKTAGFPFAKKWTSNASAEKLLKKDEEMYDNISRNLRKRIGTYKEMVANTEGLGEYAKQLDSTLASFGKIVDDQSEHLTQLKWIYEVTVSDSPLYTAMSRILVTSLSKTMGMGSPDALIQFFDKAIGLRAIGDIEAVVTASFRSIKGAASIYELFANVGLSYSNIYVVVLANPIAAAVYKYTFQAVTGAISLISKTVGYALIVAAELLSRLLGDERTFPEGSLDRTEYTKHLDHFLSIRQDEKGRIICPKNAYGSTDIRSVICNVTLKLIPESMGTINAINEWLMTFGNLISYAMTIYQTIVLCGGFFAFIGSLTFILSMPVFWVAIAGFIGLIYFLRKFERTRSISDFIFSMAISHPYLTSAFFFILSGLVVSYAKGVFTSLGDILNKIRNIKLPSLGSANTPSAKEMQQMIFEAEKAPAAITNTRVQVLGLLGLSTVFAL